MIRFKQTDPKLLPVIQTYGCAALSSIYLLPDEYDQEQVNDIWQDAVLNERIYSKGDHANEIASWAVWLGSLWSIHLASHPLSFGRIAGQAYVCEPNEREIIKWYLSNVKEHHFTVGDGRSNTAWDSMDRPDIMRAYATFVQKVIVIVS